MLNLCVCDDDPGDMARVQALAERFAAGHLEFSMKIQVFSSAFDLLEHLDKKGGFDIYLLDVIMPHLNGVDLARRIRARNESAEIFFLTCSREYALDAFDVSACGYILKPVDPEKFDRALMAAVLRLTQQENRHLLLKTREGIRKILFRELVMVESFNHDRICSLVDGSKAVTADTLASLMTRLSDDPRFFVPHRAYIINMEHIAALNAPNVLMSTGQRVPVSRASFASLKRAYLGYLF